MKHFKRTIFFLITLAVLGVVGAPEAKADPVHFGNVQALQNGGFTSVDLFTNPGATLMGPQISFLIDITGTLPPGVTNILQVTYTEAGSSPIIQSFSIPAFGIVPPPYSQLVTFTSPGANAQGVAVTFTIDILQVSPDFIIPSGPNAGLGVNSFSYQFTVVDPVPEPATMILLGTGVFGLVGICKRKKIIERSKKSVERF